MRAEDLEHARLIADSRRLNVRMRERIASNEKLTLLIGEGHEASAIVLTPLYLASIRTDIIAALDVRIGENDAALRGLGVEP